MNVMAKAATHKRMRPAASQARKPKASGLDRLLSAEERRALDAMQVQMDQIQATLDEIEQSMRARNAW